MNQKDVNVSFWDSIVTLTILISGIIAACIGSIAGATFFGFLILADILDSRLLAIQKQWNKK